MKTFGSLVILLLTASVACRPEPSPEAAPGADAAVSERSADRTDAVLTRFDGDTVAAPVRAPTYVLDNPTAVFALADELAEISGLTLMDDSHLAAIQDEKGNIYLIDAETGAVVREIDFGSGGDYEGVARVGEELFVLESDGDLFHLDRLPDDDKKDADRLKSTLHRSCDAEGLAYDSRHERLLIACKEFAGHDYRGHRAIYAFDLGSRALLPEPVFLLNLAELETKTERPAGEHALREVLRKAFDTSDFKPSGLAVHPQTGDLWVLSSVMTAIAVLDESGNLVALHHLSGELFRQPEGLAIGPDGSVYIASEAGGGKRTAVLAVFRPQN